MTELDREMRERLRAAFEGESAEPPSSSAAALLASAGADHVRAGWRRRRIKQGLVAALAAAVPCGWFLASTMGDAASAPSPLADRGRVCEGYEDLPARGPLGPGLDHDRIVLSVEDGEASMVEASACSTRVRLESGAIDVHARELGGGTLVVETEGGEVEVLGTRFRVATSESGMVVSVSEGRVRVRPVGEAPRELRAGERYGVDDAELATASHADRHGEPEAGGGAGDVAHDRQAHDRQAHDARAADVPPGSRSERRRPPVASPREPGPGSDSPVEADLSADELVGLAESALERGDMPEARRLFTLAGAGSNVTAEAAWVRLARAELGAGRPGAALRALRSRQRFGRGFFGAEAAWLEVQAAEARNDIDAARAAAQRLQQEYPQSSYGVVAGRWLDERGR